MANAVTRYNLAQFVFNDTQIRTETFKTTRKLSSEELKACNSHTPYAVMFKDETFTWECSDIDPVFRGFFETVIEEQKADPSNLAMVSTYDYSEITGDLVEDDVFDEVWIEELSKENANKPFTVKGGAKKKI